MNRGEWLVAAVITVVAVAIGSYLLRDIADEPQPTGEGSGSLSEHVMTAAVADDLLRALTQQGWHCFDSLPLPVVKRCFLDQPAGDDGTVSAEVALTYGDEDLDRVSLYAEGEGDAGEHLDVADRTAGLVGDLLLAGAGPEVAEQLGDRHEVQIAGRRVYGNRAGDESIQVVVESASYSGSELPTPELPAEPVLVRNAEVGGMRCDVGNATTTCRTFSNNPIRMTITMSLAAGRVRSLSISAYNVATPRDPAVVNMVAGYLYVTDVGGGPAVSRWVHEQAGTTVPVRADLGGLHLRLEGGGARPIYLSVGEITN
jgi:hypothetical protein